MTNDCGRTEQKRTDLVLMVLMVLGMILEKEEKRPSREAVEALEVAEQQQITRWCRAMHAEASTDPDYLAEHPEEMVGPAPECLRRILPKDHYLQQWRVAATGA